MIKEVYELPRYISDRPFEGPLRQMFFVVLLPDGTVVVPSVEKRL